VENLKIEKDIQITFLSYSPRYPKRWKLHSSGPLRSQ